MKFTSTAVAAGLLLQQAAATNWGGAKSFSNPSNTNNLCTPEQKAGFNWGGLSTGNFGKFGGFNFQGFSCKDSFKPKTRRSLKTRSNFQNKCIQGSVSKNGGSGPKISGGDKDFSISEMQVSVSFDTDLDFIFSMPDGSTCKHTASCSAGGSVVKNEQCGGAKEVTFQMPRGGSDKGCDIGIHSIGFDCQSASTPGTLVSTSTTSKASSSAPVTTTPQTTSSSFPVTLATTAPSSSSSSSVPTTTPPATPSAPQTTPESSKPETTAPTTPATTPATPSAPQTTPESSKPETTAPTTPVTTATSDLVTTEITVVTLTTCPITTTTTSGNLTITQTTSTISTTTLTSTATFCPKCGEKPPTIIAVPTGGSTNLPPPPPPTSDQPPPPTSDQPPPPPPTTSQAPPPPPPTSQAPPPSPPPPASSAPTTPAPPQTTEVITTDITTEIVITSLSSCPVTLVTTSAGSTITSVTTTLSTVIITSTSTICTQCTAAPPSTLSTANPAPPASSSPAPSVPPVQNNGPDLPCPDLLPRCLNTWLPQTCSSNSDTACFCPSPSFAGKVIDCMKAWSASDAELSEAASYFAGVCADFIPQNPGICTNVPSTITLSPVLVPTGQGNVEVPKTTVQLVKTITITKDSKPEASIVTSQITVPQVQFITQTPAPLPVAAGETAAPAPIVSVGLVAANTAVPTNVVPVAPVSGSSTYSWRGSTPSASASFKGPATFTGGAGKKEVGYGVAAGVLGVVAFLV